MSFPSQNLKSLRQTAPRAADGFTLVELLVAVSILSLIAVLIIPQIRFLNRERGIREAARVTGSIFVDAANRARVDGYAAVGIRRNPNYVRKVNSPNGVHDLLYAANSLYLLRRLPPYTGNDEDTVDSFATVVSSTSATFPLSGTLVVRIPTPLDATLATQVKRGCWLQLGSVATPLYVDQVNPDGTFLRLTCVLPNHLPGFPLNQPLRFRLDRPLVPVPNSEVALPRGYYINLNYSGPTTAQTAGVAELSARDTCPVTWTYFSEDRQTMSTNFNPNDVLVVFGPNGGLDRIYSNGEVDGALIPTTSLNLCVSSDEFGNSFDTAADSLPRSVAEGGRDLLSQEDVMWVSINMQSGGVFVSPIASVSTPVSSPDAVQPQRILQSQSFRLVGQSAGQ
ncbi:MAG: type II secretion system protein [Planctomycetota bacterium]|nr:type II secretion system GspH family protein [Blastopirellula sp.]